MTKVKGFKVHYRIGRLEYYGYQAICSWQSRHIPSTLKWKHVTCKICLRGHKK